MILKEPAWRTFQRTEDLSSLLRGHLGRAGPDKEEFYLCQGDPKHRRRKRNIGYIHTHISLKVPVGYRTGQWEQLVLTHGI